jgi:dTDP-4-amino-4,6-dideoxy-D-glucose/dTDP-4-amino-2,4-dideoxy-beta-L-xylose transaminase
MIPLSKAAVSPTALDRIAEVLHSGQLEHGPLVDRFERAIGTRIDNHRTVAVNCGTSAIQLGLRVVQLTSGAGRGQAPPGEVLTTPLTFEGTNWPILAAGLRIRWVDVDPATLTIDLDDLARKISPASRAILVVHWLGFPVDLDKLAKVVEQAEQVHGVRPLVIEDCAQAWGATYQDRPLGSHGNICAFSFQAIKVLTCGSGGMLALPDDRLWHRAMLQRWHGIPRGADRASASYDVSEWGYRFTMSEVSAAIGLANLEMVDTLIQRHRDNAAYYDRELAGVPGLEHTERPPDREPSFWMYPVKVADRPAFRRRLAEDGIATGLIGRRNDAHTCVDDDRTHLPGLDSVYDRLVYLPVGWWLSDEDRERVVATIRSGW